MKCRYHDRWLLFRLPLLISVSYFFAWQEFCAQPAWPEIPNTKGMLINSSRAENYIQYHRDTLFLFQNQHVWAAIPVNKIPALIRQIRISDVYNLANPHVLNTVMNHTEEVEDVTLQQTSNASDGVFKELRIALDPGHFADNIIMAKWEKKFVQIQDSTGKDQFIFESYITWLTARILQDMIEREGGEVLMTKGLNQTALGITATAWLNGDWRSSVSDAYNRGWIDSATRVEILKLNDKKLIIRQFFRSFELLVRSEKINAFKPDLAISIHYNVEEKNVPDREGYHLLHDKNYSMVFLPGAYAPNELSLPQDQLSFIYQCYSGQIEKSQKAARIFEQVIIDSLLVPPVLQTDTIRLSYLAHYSLLDTVGVYYRNLAILRQVRYQIILVEPFLQDNKTVFMKLLTPDSQYITRDSDTLQVPCIILQTARTYYHALLLWQKSLF